MVAAEGHAVFASEHEARKNSTSLVECRSLRQPTHSSLLCGSRDAPGSETGQKSARLQYLDQVYARSISRLRQRMAITFLFLRALRSSAISDRDQVSRAFLSTTFVPIHRTLTGRRNR